MVPSIFRPSPLLQVLQKAAYPNGGTKWSETEFPVSARKRELASLFWRAWKIERDTRSMTYDTPPYAWKQLRAIFLRAGVIDPNVLEPEIQRLTNPTAADRRSLAARQAYRRSVAEQATREARVVTRAARAPTRVRFDPAPIVRYFGGNSKLPSGPFLRRSLIKKVPPYRARNPRARIFYSHKDGSAFHMLGPKGVRPMSKQDIAQTTIAAAVRRRQTQKRVGPIVPSEASLEFGRMVRWIPDAAALSIQKRWHAYNSQIKNYGRIKHAGPLSRKFARMYVGRRDTLAARDEYNRAHFDRYGNLLYAANWP